MIAGLLCLCQLAAAGEIQVRTGADVQRVSIVRAAKVPFVSWTQLQTAFGARLRMLPNGRALLDVSGVQFEISHGVPFVRVNDQVIPMAAAPRVAGDSAVVPLQMIAQILPRIAEGVKYTASTRTMVLPVAAPAVETGTQAAPEKPVPARRRIVIDAGHGGPDEGTSVTTRAGAHIAEKSITLGVATLLGDELRRRGFDVLQTRSRDTLIALHDRGRIANDLDGSAFISIHVNSAGGSSGKAVRGVETYFLSAARTEDDKRVQAIENASARYEEKSSEPRPDNTIALILRDMQENEHLRESSRLATGIQRTLSRTHPGGDRGVKQAEFAVLVGAFMPAALVEIGFLSNEKDASFLVKKENQKKIALAIADATTEYFKGYDRRVIANGDGK